MKNIEQSNLVIKANVTLKSRILVPPMDNMPKGYFDVRYDNILTNEQKIKKLKMQFWAKNILNENYEPVEEECYKGCKNCGELNNNCKRPQNKTRTL